MSEMLALQAGFAIGLAVGMAAMLLMWWVEARKVAKRKDSIWVELASVTNDRLTLVELRLDRIEDILAKGEDGE